MTELCRELGRRRYRYASEVELQDGIEIVLRDLGVSFERERRLSSAHRIDFLCESGVGIEVKLDGSLTDLVRQLHGYAQCPEVAQLVVVTSRLRLSRLPEEISGKRVQVVALLGGLV